MKHTLSTAFRCFFSVLILNLMCFLIYGSLVTVALSIGETEISGYQVVTYDEAGNPVDSEFCTKEEKDAKVAVFEAEKTEYIAQEIKVLTEKSNNVVKWLTGICGFVILFGMIYTTTWARGDKDNNLSTFGDIDIDDKRGIKIGILAAVPFALAYLFFWVDKLLPQELYGLGTVKILNYYLFPVVELITGTATTANDVSVLASLALLITLVFVPMIAVLGYHCGSNGISLKEKLLYVKKEKK